MASSATKQWHLATICNPAREIMAIVPLNQVYVTANYKETQLGGVRPGQHVDDHRRHLPRA